MNEEKPISMSGAKITSRNVLGAATFASSVIAWSKLANSLSSAVSAAAWHTKSTLKDLKRRLAQLIDGEKKATLGEIFGEFNTLITLKKIH